jgi:hypothetical protein
MSEIMSQPAKRQRTAPHEAKTRMTILDLPHVALELILHGALGTLANSRIRVLSASKSLYHCGALWGNSALFKIGSHAPAGWLSMRTSIKSVTFYAIGGPILGTLSARDTAVLRGARKVTDIALDYNGGRASTVADERERFITQVEYPKPRLLLSSTEISYFTDLGLFYEAVPTLQHLSLVGWRDASSAVFLVDPLIRELWMEQSRRLLVPSPPTPAPTSVPLPTSAAGAGILPIVSLSMGSYISFFNLNWLRGAQLTKLYITGNGNLGDISGIEDLPLVELHYKSCKHDKHMEVVAHLKKTLLHLDLGDSAITDAALLILGQAGMGLRSLSLAGCKEITAAGIAHLEGMSSSLKTLDLRGTQIKTEDCPPRLRYRVRV